MCDQKNVYVDLIDPDFSQKARSFWVQIFLSGLASPPKTECPAHYNLSTAMWAGDCCYHMCSKESSTDYRLCVFPFWYQPIAVVRWNAVISVSIWKSIGMLLTTRVNSQSLLWGGWIPHKIWYSKWEFRFRFCSYIGLAKTNLKLSLKCCICHK